MFRFNKKERGLVTEFFDVSVFLKGIDGALEILAGVALLVVPLEKIKSILFWLTRGELAEDKKDIIANFLVKAGNSISVKAYDSTIFYLLLHGAVKVMLVYLLLKKVIWAYPVAIGVFSIFGVYQMYQYTINHSIFLLLLTLLDIIVIVLTWLEYRIILRKI